MPLIDYAEKDEVPDAVQQRLESFRETRGRYSSLQLLLANNPESMLAHGEFSNTVLNRGNVDQYLKELAHLTVSLANDCEYCISSHAEGLVMDSNLSSDHYDALVREDNGDFDDRQRAVVEFARQTAVDPKRVTAAHVDALHDTGFTDEDVVELLVLVGQAIGANAMADAMNVHASDHDEGLGTYYPD